jgi:hypothetical protein
MKRALILAVVLGAGLSSIFVLPPFRVAESAMSMEIPKTIGDWQTKLIQPSEKEITSLAKDTRFSKATCVLPRKGTSFADGAEISIVLSGQDLANSIHRPERCMAAQGHAIYGSEKVAIEVPDEPQLPTRRLLSKVKFGSEKEMGEVKSLTYYFFVGNETITESHKTRTLVDIRDRLQKGQAQKWAYVLVSTYFRDETDTDPRLANLPDRETADRQMRGLLSNIAASNISWKQVTAIN